MGNLLSEVHPELIEQWSERNLPLTPDKITYGSNKIVWWKGACGHDWQTSIKARSNGENCPICSGARVVEGINDLATLKPELAAEWSSKNKTLKPTMVSVGSHKKVIWKGKCGHEWTATVKSRAISGTGCPYCSHNKVLEGFMPNDGASVLGDSPLSDNHQLPVSANAASVQPAADLDGETDEEAELGEKTELNQNAEPGETIERPEEGDTYADFRDEESNSTAEAPFKSSAASDGGTQEQDEKKMRGQNILKLLNKYQTK